MENNKMGNMSQSDQNTLENLIAISIEKVLAPTLKKMAKSIESIEAVQNDKLYTVRDISEMAQVDEQTVRKHIKMKTLKPFKIGRKYVVNKIQLDKYLNRDKSKSNE